MYPYELEETERYAKEADVLWHADLFELVASREPIWVPRVGPAYKGCSTLEFGARRGAAKGLVRPTYHNKQDKQSDETQIYE